MSGFGLADLIRVNQFVRHRINFMGFKAWYDSLQPERGLALIHLLCELAHQAGLSEAIWDEALVASGLPVANKTVQMLLGSQRGKPPLYELSRVLDRLPETEVETAFRLCVYLFGIAEGNVYRGESERYCNHWWHRDLLDERVVQDLLNDPHFYRTAMKDDSKIKGNT